MAESAANEVRPRPTLLIVDDLPANLGVLLDFLDTAGYDVLVAESGAGALLQLEYARPDIILLDVQMPGGMDGYATCERLKADARWRDVPVLFVTALSEPVDKVRGFEVGAVDFITKPLHPGEVLARVRAHLQIRALQQSLEQNNALLQHAVARRIEAENLLAQSLDRAVLVVRDGNAIEFCTRLARRLLARYFPGRRTAGPSARPSCGLGVRSRRSAVAGAVRGGAFESPAFHRSGGGWRRRLHAPSGRNPAADLLIDSPAQLHSLGLTAREAEVLYWIAHGKSNPEMAVILDCALNTVKKHVQNILLKLGVESRLAAALRAVELLGLSGVDVLSLRAD